MVLQELKQDGRRGCGLGISFFGSGKGRAGAIGRAEGAPLAVVAGEAPCLAAKERVGLW